MSAIQIFKPKGALTSMEGVQVSLTAADLQDIATAYNPNVHEAPLTIGHPTHDAPAYGWVKSLSFADGALNADCEQSVELGELVSKGHYKKVSASFYTPGAPGNPTPGKWALRHVGFLGAQPPGVKGLKAVSFADGEEGVVTFGELPGYAGTTIARLLGNLREWFIAKEGQDKADQVLSKWEIESLREMSQRADEISDSNISGGTPALSFAEPGNAAISLSPSNQETPMTKTAEQLQAALDVANASIKTLQDADVARQATERQNAATTRHAGHVSFCDGLVAAAKWPKDGAAALVAALDVLATPADAGVVSFGEGEAAKPLVAVLQDHLQAMPASVSFSEFAKSGSGGKIELSNQEVAGRAAAYQQKVATSGRAISLAQAVDAVNAGTDQA